MGLGPLGKGCLEGSDLATNESSWYPLPVLLRPTCSIETLHSASEQRFQASGWFHFCGTEDRKLSGMNCSLLRLILISGCNSHSFLSHIAQCRSSSLSASILAGLGCSFGSVQFSSVAQLCLIL